MSYLQNILDNTATVIDRGAISNPVMMAQDLLGKSILALTDNSGIDDANRQGSDATGARNVSKASPFENILGISSKAKARDTVNDRRDVLRSNVNAPLKRDAAKYGISTKFEFDPRTGEFKNVPGRNNENYRAVADIQSDLDLIQPQRAALVDANGGDELSLAQLSKAAGVPIKSLSDLTPARVQELANSFRTTRQLNSDAATVGIDLQGQLTPAQKRELIRKKQTANEIEAETAKSEAADEVYKNSTRGKRDDDIHKDNLATNRSTRRINSNTDERSGIRLNNEITQQNYTNQMDKWKFEKELAELSAGRQHDLAVRQAEHSANVETINLQNEADMARYELMLENDRQKNQSDSIGELMGALTMLGGAFML